MSQGSVLYPLLFLMFITICDVAGQGSLSDDSVVHDKEHILEDSGGVLTKEQLDKMTEKELEYHYFKMHDFDSNHKLDGVELWAALGHGKGDQQTLEEKVDDVLHYGDRNKDGYVNYGEYCLGRQKGKMRTKGKM